MSGWNSTLTRKAPMRRAGFTRKPFDPKAGRPKLAFKKGRKTLEWDAARAKIKIEFQRAGITVCESASRYFAS